MWPGSGIGYWVSASAGEQIQWNLLPAGPCFPVHDIWQHFFPPYASSISVVGSGVAELSEAHI